jgi:hypothetical protein
MSSTSPAFEETDPHYAVSNPKDPEAAIAYDEGSAGLCSKNQDSAKSRSILAPGRFAAIA